MRKRPALRPALESVEDRLVLAASGAHAALSGLAADRAHASPARAAHHVARPATVHVHRHPAEASGHPRHKSSSSLSSTLSNLFLKSIFPF